MRTNPISETELQRELYNLLPDGTYDFEVAFAVDKTSNSGNEMIELLLKVFGPDGAEYQIRDWLVDSDHALPRSKIRHFCRSTGLMDAYDNDHLDAVQCEGACGKVKLFTHEDDFGSKNRVRDYITEKPTEEKKPELPLKPLAEEAAELSAEVKDKEIPF